MTRLARRCKVAARHPLREYPATLFYFPCTYIYFLYNIYLYLYVFIDLHANKYYSIWQFLSYVKKLSARKTCSRTRGSVPAFVISTGAMIYSIGTFTLLNFLHFVLSRLSTALYRNAVISALQN